MLAFLPEDESPVSKWQTVYPSRNAPAFRLQSAVTGKHVRLGDINAEKIILTFVPGMWAPWCRKFIDELSHSVEAIYQNQALLVTIVSQDYDQLTEYVDRNFIDFEMLADPHGVINTRYGIFEDAIVEPMKISKPSIFILDNDKNIHYKFIGRHLTDRLTAAEVVEMSQRPLPVTKKRRMGIPLLSRLLYAGN